jgi:antitoxin CptB
VGTPAALDDPEALEALLRKLTFRAWHRGTCEADLLIGSFADQCLVEFTAVELRQFERLLEEDDPPIDDWITGRQFVPEKHDNPVIARLRLFRLSISTHASDRPKSRCASRPERDGDTSIVK